MRRIPATSVAIICVIGLTAGCAGQAPPSGPGPAESTAVADPTDSASVPAEPAPTTAGNAGGGGGGGGGNPAPEWPAPEDCIAYNPSNLTTNYAAGIWSVKDGAKEVMRLHGGPSDNTGQKGMALAKRFKAHCFIGRNNNREEKYSFIFDYWRNPSGINTTIPDQEEDCSPYDRHNITMDDMDDNAFRVKDHDHVLHGFDTETDAKNGKLVLGKYNQICFLGDSGADDTMGQELVNYML
jgi:hypothetical protein